MRSKWRYSTGRTGTDLERRRLLVAIGWLPFAVPAAGALLGCSGGEQSSAPAAGGTAPQRAGEPPRSPAAGGGVVAPGVAAPGAAAKSSGDALITEIAANRATVEALQYVNESPKPDQSCANCQFYTAKNDDRGACQLFQQGLVTAGGWCASWAKRIPG